MGANLLFSHDHIQIIGNTDIFFTPCKRLLECSEMLVQLQTAKHSIAVWGQNLTATDFGAEGLHVEGTIASIEFDGGLR